MLLCSSPEEVDAEGGIIPSWDFSLARALVHSFPYLLSTESCHTILKTVLVGLVFLMVSRIGDYVVLNTGIRMCQLAWGLFNVRADLVSGH